MKIEVVLFYEDPNAGVKGSRKFWAYRRGFGRTDGTYYGRIPYGTSHNIESLMRDGRYVGDSYTDEEAQKYYEKKLKEKVKKGYVVASHVVDDVDMSCFSAHAKDERNRIHLKNWS